MERRSPYKILSKEQIQACINKLDSTPVVKDFALASSGLANTNYIVSLESGETVVLRIHSNNSSKSGLKELKLSKLLTDFREIPKVLYFKPNEDDFSYSIIEFVTGTVLAETKLTQTQLTTTYFELGAMLAKLRSIKFKSPWLLNENLEIEPIKTKNTKFHTVTNFILDCIEDPIFTERVGANLKESIQKFIVEHDHVLYATDDECHLIHGDFKVENIMIKPLNNKIHLSGVLDWEHARSDSTYGDIATLFRGNYDRNLHLKQAFSDGFEMSGAKLIQEWDKVSKIIDLVNICSFLCSSSERPTLYEIMIKHLKDTIDYFK